MQPIRIERTDITKFEVFCDNEFYGNLFESLIKRICQVPADFKSKLKSKMTEGGSEL